MAIEPGIAMVGGAVAGMQALTPLALLGLLPLSSGSATYGGTPALTLGRRFLSRPEGALTRPPLTGDLGNPRARERASLGVRPLPVA
jgi:hypothetical protein